MNIDLTGKRAVVAGGSRGIGRAIALTFAEAGAGVSICARGTEALARRETTSPGTATPRMPRPAISPMPPPFRAISRRRRARSAASTSWSTMLRALAPATTRPAGRRAFRSICWRPCGRRVRPCPTSKNPMRERLSTSRRFRGFAPRPAPRLMERSRRLSSNTPRLWRRNWRASTSASTASRRARSNFPGGTWERAKNNNPPLYAAILRSIPFGRLGRPEEVARVALFLASPLAGWVTGQNIAVDGGQML